MTGVTADQLVTLTEFMNDFDVKCDAHTDGVSGSLTVRIDGIEFVITKASDEVPVLVQILDDEEQQSE